MCVSDTYTTNAQLPLFVVRIKKERVVPKKWIPLAPHDMEPQTEVIFFG